MSHQCSIIIPNWNGLQLLRRCIPSLLEAIGDVDGQYEIIVVDNGSTDDSVTYLKHFGFPVQVQALKENVGFARACNLGATAAQHQILLFLNNDMYFAPTFLRPLLDSLQRRRDVFAVSAQLLDWESRFQGGRVCGRFILGSFQIEADRELYTEPCYTLYTSGAVSAMQREKFEALGGFDETLYVYEDVDIGYRAWKRGWVSLYEPRSVVYHKGRATSKTIFSNQRYLTIDLKNRFWFMWKNITERALERRYWALLPLSLTYLTIRLHSFAPLLAFGMAFRERERVLRRRQQELPFVIRTDTQVLRFVKENIYVTD